MDAYMEGGWKVRNVFWLEHVLPARFYGRLPKNDRIGRRDGEREGGMQICREDGRRVIFLGLKHVLPAPFYGGLPKNDRKGRREGERAGGLQIWRENGRCVIFFGFNMFCLPLSMGFFKKMIGKGGWMERRRDGCIYGGRMEGA